MLRFSACVVLAMAIGCVDAGPDELVDSSDAAAESIPEAELVAEDTSAAEAATPDEDTVAVESAEAAEPGADTPAVEDLKDMTSPKAISTSDNLQLQQPAKKQEGCKDKPGFQQDQQ